MPYRWDVPTHFFVTKGKAASETEKGAQQKAYMEANVHQYNLDPKSSVLPPNAQLIEIPKIPFGSILHCVLAEEKGVRGQSIAAGIGYAYMKGKNGEVESYIAENHGKKEERAVEEDLMFNLVDMAEKGNLTIYNRGTDEVLFGKEEWLKHETTIGKHFDEFRGAEQEYKKYIKKVGGNFIKTEIIGIDKISDDYGHVMALLGFVLE